MLSDLLVVLAALAAAGDGPPGIPPACLEQHGRVDDRACAAAAAPGSRESRIAYNNLGLRAVMRGDFAAATRFFDQAEPSGGQTLKWSASARAYRAYAYDHVGRDQAAAAEAHLAQRLLREPEPAGADGPKIAATDTDAVLWAAVLPIMKKADDPDLAAALAAYQALPATGWQALANRAGVLSELGDQDGAFAAMRKVLKIAPETYGVLNNACYILARTGHAADGLRYCYRAVQMAPNLPKAHDSWAIALASLGRCEEARAQREEARRLDPAAADYQKPLSCPAAPAG